MHVGDYYIYDGQKKKIIGMEKQFVNEFTNRVVDLIQQSPHFDDLKKKLSELTTKFDTLKLVEITNFIEDNNVRLSYYETKELVKMLPNSEDNWKHIYEHLIYSRIRNDERHKLRQHYGVEGYYHPSGGYTEDEMLKAGLSYTRGNISLQYAAFAMFNK